jgi:SMI1 / KNR4 family (SUKH-1)
MSKKLARSLAPHFPRFAELLAAGRGEIENIEPPTSDADIRALENGLGVSLPDSYKQLLRCARGFWLFGGSVQFGTQHPFFHEFPPWKDLTAQQREIVKLKRGKWPPPSEGMLCFAEFFMEADGDQVLFDVKNCFRNGEYPVVYYAHESRPPRVRKFADDFRAFLEGLLDREEFRDEDE